MTRVATDGVHDDAPIPTEDSGRTLREFLRDLLADSEWLEDYRREIVRLRDVELIKKTADATGAESVPVGSIPSSCMTVGTSWANTGAAAVPPNLSIDAELGSSIDTSIVTLGAVAGKKPTKDAK